MGLSSKDESIGVLRIRVGCEVIEGYRGPVSKDESIGMLRIRVVCGVIERLPWACSGDWMATSSQWCRQGV